MTKLTVKRFLWHTSVIGVAVIVGAMFGAPVVHEAHGTRIVAAFDSGETLANAVRQLKDEGYPTTTHDDLRAVEVIVTGAADVADVRRDIDGMPGLRFAEVVRPMRIADSPAEPLYGRQSDYLAAVRAPEAWDIERGNRDVIVAVIDTGIDVVHPDLRANVWTNDAEVANNGVDDDNNGCVDDVNGCAFVTDSTIGCENVTNGYVRDEVGHGTFVAGVIAAAENGAGIVGIARGVRVMAVKVLDCYGAGDSVAVARGILYAVRNGAAVINVSLGGLEDAAVVRDAVNVARSSNVLVVAAAGNGGGPPLSFPARIPAVLSVGATTPAGTARASFSSYGPGIDVVAGGEGIWSSVPLARCNQFIACSGRDPYGASSGTSFSAPQVSGLVALMLSRKRSLSPDDITGIIRATATAMPPGATPGWAGAGRVNMVAALRAVTSPVPAGDACTIASVHDGESFSCTDGRRVRMLQIDAASGAECGAGWAKAALEFIFLPPGRTVYLRYDDARTDATGSILAVPIWRGDDGNDYNLSITMVFIGLARTAEIGGGNVLFQDWASASERWAATVQWNMWAPGKPYAGGC